MGSQAGVIAGMESWVGVVPYEFGGLGPEMGDWGADCSGSLYYWANIVNGFNIPRNSVLQWNAMEHVTNPWPGCFAFFNVPSDGPAFDQPGHVGLFMGDGMMIDEPYPGTFCRWDSIYFSGGWVMGYACLPGTGPDGPAPTPKPKPPPPPPERTDSMVCDVPTGGILTARPDGTVDAFEGARFYGSMAGQKLNAPIVGICSTKTGNGYWLVAADGGIFAFGDAKYLGPNPAYYPKWGLGLGGGAKNIPIIGIARGNAGGYTIVGDNDGPSSALYSIPSNGSLIGAPS